MLYVIKGKPLRGQDHEKNYVQISHFQIFVVVFLLIFGFNLYIASIGLTLFIGRVAELLWPVDDLNNKEKADNAVAELENVGIDPDKVLRRMSKFKNI